LAWQAQIDSWQHFYFMRIIITVIFICHFSNLMAQIQYPATKRQEVTDDYFGTKIADPYRWLEQDNAEDTKAWVSAQNKVTSQYLSQIQFRESIRNRLTNLWNYAKYSAPVRHGEYFYFAKNDGLQNQPVYYRQRTTVDVAEVFLDPNTLSTDGTVALTSLTFSKNNRFAAYTTAKSGSDWNTAYVMDVETGKLLDDHLEWLKFCEPAWVGDKGFFYTRYPQPSGDNALKGINLDASIHFHNIGTPQSEDMLVYEDPEHPAMFMNVHVTEDEDWLWLSKTEGTSGVEILAQPMFGTGWTAWKKIIPGFKTEASIIDSYKGDLLVLTNDGAPNYKIVLVNPAHPGKEYWKVVISEQEEVMSSVSTAGGFIMVKYLKDASDNVFQYDYDGKMIRKVSLPGIGTSANFEARKQEDTLYFSFTSFTQPGNIYQYNIETGISTLYRETEAGINTDDYTTEQLFFASKDGTKVPIFLSYKKGLKKDGNLPVKLYGYGGFNYAITPFFSWSNYLFMEQGGISVVVSLRGGSEYGEAWHDAGKLDKKQNVFDDFIAAAEYLVKEGYTNPGKIAIAGGSNGGLLVGACMTQRPDLFRVALPAVGVLDMLRYHKFTIGYAWAVEYGSSEYKEQFEYLIKYSPLHNLREGVAYPATLITTADHDDRVVPAHSFKFAARLQEVNTGKYPVLIRIDEKAGHGAGKPTAKIIDEYADVTAFIMDQLGMTFR